MSATTLPNIDAEGKFTSPQVNNQIQGAAKNVAASTTLAGRLSAPRYSGQTTTDAPATLTGKPTATITAPVSLDYASMATLPAGSPNQNYWRVSEGMEPLEFYFEGNEIEVLFTRLNDYGYDTDIWVDDRPVAAAPFRDPAADGSTTVYLYLKWTTARLRKLRFTNFGAALRSVLVPNHAQQIYPVPATPTVGILTDSFGAATNYATNFEAFPYVIEKTLNTNLVRSPQGGTGYIAGGPFAKPYAHQDRRDKLKLSKLDALLFFGTINDPAAATNETLRAAFNATWDAYAADHPGTPFVVYGVQPSSAPVLSDTNNHRRNSVMYQAAVDHPQVVGFVDMLGTAKTGAVPPVWSASATYKRGDLVTRAGAIYSCVFDSLSGNVPPNTTPTHWRRVSWVFTGTGHSGATTGDGNRDQFLGADNVHPTGLGGHAFGRMMAGALVKVLGSGDRFTYHNV